MKSYEIVDGKLIIRDKQIIEKLDNLTDKELENVSQILRKDLDDKMKEKEMADMNPINNLDTFQGRGYQIEQMKQKLQSIQNKINQFKMELNNAPSIVQYEKQTLLNFIDSLTP